MSFLCRRGNEWFKIGDFVMLMPKNNKWNNLMTAIEMFSDDFMAEGRSDQYQQEREEL